MKSPSQKYKSPHFDSSPIPVKFLILHYTAQSFEQTLHIFSSQKPVSSHLLINEEGQVFELVKCWQGECYRAFHAGKSLWIEQSPLRKKWESFNDFSIGIELVNLNGNFFPYSPAQYETLFQVLHHLKKTYPELRNPERILGHEHIAGFRGKVDPGFLFDWKQLFEKAYGLSSGPQRNSQITKKEAEKLAKHFKTKSLTDKQSEKINLILENSHPFWLKKLQLKWLSFKSSI